MTSPTDAPASSAGIIARVLRGSGWVALGYGAGQGLRLISNLVLTRLLFPEAFGLMALVTVFLVGLQMFSDFGTRQSILQSKRGDDPDFLDTAWTVQVVRGGILWLATLALAWPAAWLYDAPLLAWLLPVAGLTLVISGFLPTRIDTANRHLNMGRITGLELAAQAVGIAAMVALALATGSIWALVVGAIIGALAKLALAPLILPGRRNRLRWERPAVAELLHFGKWIFLSTVSGFLVAQGDKAILGGFISMEMLGLYNIGFFLASFPVMLAVTVSAQVLIPLYRSAPPGASAENFGRVRRLRMGMTGGVLTLLLVLGLFGPALVGLLYDPRYAASGVLLVLIVCVQIPNLIGLSYDSAALAAGDSRRFFYLQALRGLLLVSALLAGAASHGLPGALAGQALATLAVHPVIIWLARRHGVWDALHDAVFGVLGLAGMALILWCNRGAIAMLVLPG